MEELQIENKQLKDSIKLLQQEQTELQRQNMQLQHILATAQNTICKLRMEHTKLELSPTHIILDTIKYLDTPSPAMFINCFEIYFETPRAKEAQLAKIICQHRNLIRLTKAPISIENIYGWYKNTEDWFDITSEERSAFEKSLYNSFRRLNDKLAPFFKNKKPFIISDKTWGFNPDLTIIPTTPKKP